jgi:hypothetical protein
MSKTNSTNDTIKNVIDNIDDLLKTSEQLRQTYHILLPNTLNIEAGIRLHITVITVDTTISKDYINNDIYKTPQGLYGFKLKKLTEFRDAVGMRTWGDKQDRKVGDDGRVVFIGHYLNYTLLSANGTSIVGSEIGKYDYYEDCATLIKTVKVNGQDVEKGKDQVAMKRKVADQLARTNCLSRIINKAIPKLALAYTLSDLRKPFIVAEAKINIPDIIKTAPKEIQQQLAYQYYSGLIGSFNKIFPDQPIPMLEAPTENQLPAANVNLLPASKDEPSKNIIDANYVDQNKDLTQQKELEKPKSEVWIDPDMPKDFNPEEWHRIQAEAFRDVPQKERTTAIEKLIKSRNYKRMNNTPIAEYPVARQIELIFNLRCMQPVKEES